MSWFLQKIFDIDLRKWLRPVIVLICVLALTYMAIREFSIEMKPPMWYVALAGGLINWLFAERAAMKGVLDEDGKPLVK